MKDTLHQEVVEFDFISFLSGLNMQIGDKIRQSVLKMTVGKVVKHEGITVMLLPTNTADGRTTQWTVASFHAEYRPVPPLAWEVSAPAYPPRCYNKY